MSVALEHEDVVLYERDTTVAHQEHIIGHELGHIVLNHLGEYAAIPLTKHLSDGLVGRVLCCGGANNQQEIEAEVFADLLHHSTRQSPQERETNALARRAGGALGLGD